MISAGRAAAQRTAVVRVSEQALELARNVLEIEAEAIRALVGRLDGRFLQALTLIEQSLARHGRVIVSGIQRVRPKLEVTVRSVAPPTAPESPLSRLLKQSPPGQQFRAEVGIPHPNTDRGR